MQKSTAKYALLTATVALTIGFSVGLAEKGSHAAGCTPIYGGGEICDEAKIDINKKVANPSNGELRDNLFESDSKYRVGNIVTFELVIRNTGSSTLNEVKVKDIMPSSINFHSGPGKIDGNVLTIDTGSLSAGESRSFIVRGIANDHNSGTVCGITNHAEVRAKQSGKEVGDTDSSQFCITKDILGASTVVAPIVAQLPKAGAGSLMLLTTSLTGAGLLLRKKSTN